MLYHKSFKETVLLSPIKEGATSLKIISGYASPAMASWHLMTIDDDMKKQVDISLVLGMLQDGIGKGTHEEFVQLVNKENKNNSKFKCSYVSQNSTPVHSKLYIWEKDEEPFKAFMGSANYSQIAFSSARREILCDCDPKEALKYYSSIEKDTIFCNHNEIEEYVTIKNQREMLEKLGQESGIVKSAIDENQVKLPLLTNKGDVGYGSGINWGYRRDGRKRNLNQAYIKIPSHIAKSRFFPPNKQHFSVLTDDGHQLILRVQQQGDKAITTPHNNSLLGEYLRNRLITVGVSNGDFVTKQNLLDYGRTDITFEKIDDEHFYMNFSVVDKE